MGGTVRQHWRTELVQILASGTKLRSCGRKEVPSSSWRCDSTWSCGSGSNAGHGIILVVTVVVVVETSIEAGINIFCNACAVEIRCRNRLAVVKTLAIV